MWDSWADIKSGYVVFRLLTWAISGSIVGGASSSFNTGFQAN